MRGEREKRETRFSLAAFARGRRVSACFVLGALLLATSMSAQSHAAPTGTFTFLGQAHLLGGVPCLGCPGTFTGNARGLAVNPSINCTNGCPMSAAYIYAEAGGQCVSNVPVVPFGTAYGSYTIGTLSGNFAWTRVGTIAVVVLSGPLGSAVAGFIPPQRCYVPADAVVMGQSFTF